MANSNSQGDDNGGGKKREETDHVTQPQKIKICQFVKGLFFVSFPSKAFRMVNR